MQAFEVNWLRWLFVMLVSGVGITLALYLVFYLPYRSDAPERRAEEEAEFPEGIRVGSRPIPAVLWLVYGGVLVFIVAYIIYVWMSGAGI